MSNPLTWLTELVALPAPPGEEAAVNRYLAVQVTAWGYEARTDAKGNLVVTLGDPTRHCPHIVITAHMDEIALMVTEIEDDGRIRAAAYGGAYPWKWGEGAVSLLTPQGFLTGILSFGCIHTNDDRSVVEWARHNPLRWKDAFIFTGKNRAELEQAGVRVGTRVVLAPERRQVTELGEHIASYFLDDRADLVVWLMALESLQNSPLTEKLTLTFAATASEEVGGEGAKFLLMRQPADICIALEIGPKTPEADFPIDAQPTIWVRDGYAAMESQDGYLLEECCAALEQTPHWQYLSRGGSDASCAAAAGLTARAVTLGFPTENSHGYEIMHRDALYELNRLLLAYLERLAV
jgi:putative aminopeptidase FrvX